MKHRWDLKEIARADLRGIWNFLAERDGEVRADKVLSQFFDEFDKLVFMPAKGHKREDWTDRSTARFWLVGDYWVIYYPDTVPLEILRIIHVSRDVPSLL